MRGLVLTHVFPRAAADPQAPFLLTWVHALQAAGAEVAVIAPHDAGLPRIHHIDGVAVRRVRYGPETRERLAYRGEMHEIVRTPSGPLLLGSLLGGLARAIRGAVRSGQPDVLHVHWWVPGAIAARMAGVDTPRIVTVHGTDVAVVAGRPWLVPLARWALDGARVEAVSADLADRLEEATGVVADAINPMPVSADRLEALPDRQLRLPDAPLRILGVGRLVPDKGFTDLLEAAARLDVPTFVELVGEGPERDALARRAAALGVPLDLVGPVPPEVLRACYAGTDVVVQPSHREGFGLVAAEAALAGVPVVATDSGGVRDVLGDVALVAPGDVAGLAAALADVAADPEGAMDRAAEAGTALRGLLTPDAAATRTLTGWMSAAAGEGS